MNKHVKIWSLQDAKAKFSEVVRRAKEEGPQLVTVHGKAAVEVVAVRSEIKDEDETGASLVRILENSPLRLLGKHAIRRSRVRARNRPIDL